MKIFLFPVAKRAGTVHGIYKPVKAKNACDSSDQQVLYTCLSGKKDRGESSRPTYTNLLHSRFNPVRVYTCAHSRKGPKRRRLPGGRESNACLRPFIGLRTPLRGATYARIRPYTCNYFGQSVPVKSELVYIYSKVNGNGIRCRFMIVWWLPSIFGML